MQSVDVIEFMESIGSNVVRSARRWRRFRRNWKGLPNEYTKFRGKRSGLDPVVDEDIGKRRHVKANVRARHGWLG